MRYRIATYRLRQRSEKNKMFELTLPAAFVEQAGLKKGNDVYVYIDPEKPKELVISAKALA